MRVLPRTRGLVLCLSLALAYVALWNPLRGALTQYAVRPAATLMAARWERDLAVVPTDANAHTLHVVRARTGERLPRGYTAPAGLLFVVPALGLALLFPRRRHWVYLLGAHLVLGAAALAAFMLGMGPWPYGLVVQRFVETTLAEALSLVAPVLALAAYRSSRDGSAARTPSLPASSLPASSLPASSLPASSLPASSLPAS
ncbi:MAG: hypothetical protein ACK41D_08220 [Rubricoccaceae bacterium]